VSGAEIKLTAVVRDVLDALLILEGTGDCYGMALSREAGRTSGTVYPILKRMAQAGLLEATPEEGDAQALRRPLRVVYTFTPAGRRVAETARSTETLATTTAALRIVLLHRTLRVHDPRRGTQRADRVVGVYHDAQRVYVCFQDQGNLALVDRDEGVTLADWEMWIGQSLPEDAPPGPTHGTSP
jgi:DNA-binding PadR family transcriptional regulator